MKTYIKSLIKNTSSQLITYEEFMSAALYHPTLGYYMKAEEKIGPQGDFITTSNVSDHFGRIFAKWYIKKVEIEGVLPAVCEIGGGNGRFAKSFIQEWRERSSIPLQYSIVESSPYHRKLQRELLPDNSILKQVESLNDVPAFEGLVFSNELFDALPVRVIVQEHGELFEVMIGFKNNDFIEERIPLDDEMIINYLQESGLVLKDNQRIEIPLAMDQMLYDISSILTSGYVVTVDYGYTNEEWMEAVHQEGSLRGYSKHQMVTDPLKYPGEMDLTTHIHFDRLVKKGEDFGLHFQSKQRQDEFLLSEGILDELEEHFDPNPFSEQSKKNRAIRTLIMPSGMSNYFHVLIQEKNLNIKR
jgi:SAM-dependent MidA family methyltransferase